MRLVNEHRASIGLGALRTSPGLTRSALWKSRHMLAYGYFSHDDPAPPVARNARQRATDCGYPSSGFGENIAKGQRSPQAVMDAWLNSPGHRANIERPEFKMIGVGAAGAGSDSHWTQNFGITDDSGADGPPIARDDLAPGSPGVTTRVDALANDTDEEPAWMHVIGIGEISGGTAAVIEGGRAIEFTPSAAEGSLAYTVSDLTGKTATARVTVGPDVDPPGSQSGDEISFEKSRLGVDRRGRVRSKLGCPAGSGECKGKLTLKGPVGKGSSRADRAKARTLGRAKFAIDGGASATVKVKLSARGRSIVAASKRTRALARARYRDAQGERHSAEARVVIKR